uniref:Immunoglobulin V-set domain-containing protein n=1 Tax=Poecilia formosa TaxID=48698 RepID=A0A096MBU7_POEFO
MNIFIFNLFFLTPVFVFSYDFKVIQPKVQHVNPDQTASISCEHDSRGSKLMDVRLYRISQNGKEEMLCQKGASCKDVNLTLSSTKSVFTLQNIGPEAIRAAYQCEITVEYNDVDYTKRGTKTTLVYANRAMQLKVPSESEMDCSPLDESVLGWILIGLLALMFLYSCIITCLYIKRTATIWEESNNTFSFDSIQASFPKNTHE